MIEIEKGIPIPTKRKEIYPFSKMEVGDSVMCPRKWNPLPMAKKVADEKGWKFTSRKVDGGFRVWRVE